MSCPSVGPEVGVVDNGGSSGLAAWMMATNGFSLASETGGSRGEFKQDVSGVPGLLVIALMFVKVWSRVTEGETLSSLGNFCGSFCNQTNGSFLDPFVSFFLWLVTALRLLAFETFLS